MTIALIERPLCEGSNYSIYTCEPVECATLAELGRAVKEFQHKLNPCKAHRPRIGWASFTFAGRKIHLDVREAMRGYGFHARATFLLDDRRATWASICKALA